MHVMMYRSDPSVPGEVVPVAAVLPVKSLNPQQCRYRHYCGTASTSARVSTTPSPTSAGSQILQLKKPYYTNMSDVPRSLQS